MDNYNIICRTCNSQKTNLLNFYTMSSVNDNLKLHEVFSFVCPELSIQQDDKLPQQICLFCSKQLEIAYKFQKQCEKSDKELRSLLQETVKDESKEDDEYSTNGQPEELDDFHDSEDVLVDELEDTGSPEFLDDYNDEDEEASIKTPMNENVCQMQSDKSDKANFECTECHKNFLTSGGLLLHLKLAHKNIKSVESLTLHSGRSQTTTFSCKYCDEMFDNQDEQKQHLSVRHKNDSKSELSCHICKKVFLGKNKLDHHLLYHGTNQYKCMVEDCKRSFVVKYKLTDHLKRFHGIILNFNESKSLKPSLT